MSIIDCYESDYLLDLESQAFSMLELWEKSKVYNYDDARNQREAAVRKLFEILKDFYPERYASIIKEAAE